MDVSPWPFLAVGLVAGAIAAFFFACGLILKSRLAARTLELLAKGASPVEARQQLVAAGNDPQLADEVVDKVIHAAEVALAIVLLEQGASRADARTWLIAGGRDAEAAADLVREAAFVRGCRRWRPVVVPAGILLVTLGVAVLLASLVLTDGNQTGRLVTFPLAGDLTAVLGTAVLVFGGLLLAAAFRRSF